jgi:tetratricopeptide (TPR) repeat protein
MKRTGAGGWRGRIGGAALALLLAAPPAAANMWKTELELQKEAAARLEPYPLYLPRRPRAAAPVVLRLRFYADGEYRAGGSRWQDRMKSLVAKLNESLEPGFGVRFEAVDFKRWERTGPSGALGPMLEELKRADAGADVDWVVGLVAPLPLVSMSIHDLGMAEILGKHFVLRGMSSIEELQDLAKSFHLIDRADREALYGRRKAHKELVIFLHEWAHTLGGMHMHQETRVMCPTYSAHSSALLPEDIALLEAGLAARIDSRDKGAVDWTPLRSFLERNPNQGWSRADREMLAGLLAGGRPGVDKGGGSGGGGAGWSQPDVDVFNRAIALVQENKDEAAWQALAPLFSRAPRRPEVTRLACRLSHLPAAGEAAGACKEAIAAAGATEPDAFVDLGQTLIFKKQRGEALAAAREAGARAEKRGRAGDETWVWIAQLYRQLGALTWAEEALGRAGKARGADATRTEVARARSFFGLPAASERFHPRPEEEPGYADAVLGGIELLGAGKLREARAASDKALRQFPGGPGLLVLACEIGLREGHPRPAAKQCAAALAAMEELPRAHYLLAQARLATGQADAAIAPLRRALALDPRERAYWESLADVYRGLGRRKELMSLLADYAEALPSAPADPAQATPPDQAAAGH